MKGIASSKVAMVAGAVVCAGLAAPAALEGQYLDPGAGSIIVQAVIAVAVGAIAAVKLYWRKITGFLGRRSKQDPNS